MTKGEMERRKERLGDLVIAKKRTGEFDAHAPAIIQMADDLYELYKHILDSTKWAKPREIPSPKPKDLI